MSALVTATSSASITSAEIAELVGSRHDNVRVTIERLADRGVIALPASQEKATGGRPSIEFVFAGERGKRDSIVVVAQLSPEFTARLVDRWQQLEQQAALGAFAIPQTMPEALRLAAEALEGKAAAEAKALQLEHQSAEQQAQLAEAAPKVAALDRIARADGGICITVAAKDLQMRPRDLFQWLQAYQWIYRRAGGSSWLAYQSKIQQGLLAHKVTTVERSDGTAKQVEQVLVTPKGLTKLAQILESPPPAPLSGRGADLPRPSP